MLFARRPGDGIGHRVADQQADQGREKGNFQRTQIGGQVETVLAEEDVVAEVEHDVELLLDVLEDRLIGRNGDRGFRKADLQHDGEGQQEEQEQLG